MLSIVTIVGSWMGCMLDEKMTARSCLTEKKAANDLLVLLLLVLLLQVACVQKDLGVRGEGSSVLSAVDTPLNPVTEPFSVHVEQPCKILLNDMRA